MSKEVKRKVLFVIDTLQTGGAEKSLYDNVTRFINIHPVVCHIYKGDNLKRKITEKGVRVYSLNISAKYGFKQAYTGLKKVIAQEQPDLMVAYLTRSEIVTRLAGKTHHIPVVGTFISDLYSKDYNNHLSWKSKLGVTFFRHVNKWMSSICVGFVANSSAIKDANALYLNIQPEKIKVINRGRESVKIVVKSNEPHSLMSHIRFLNVGRLIPVKAQKELILGFKTFLEVYPLCTLNIVGDGPMMKELVQIIANNGMQEKVTLLGERNDVQSILSEYDCFIFPSISEGFSGAIVEAMFAKLPVLASNIQQNKEAVQHMKTGFLFERSSVQAIEKAMLWFADNVAKANEMAEDAYKYAKENFELSNRVEEFEVYLQSTI